MAYDIQNTRGTTIVSLGDNTIDNTSTSINLVGKNTPNYGDALNESILHVMENFAASASPTAPLEGQLWYDVTNQDLKVYRKVGTNYGWVSTQRSVGVASPSSLTVKDGDTWYDSSNKQLRVYNSATATWDLVGPDYTVGQQLTGQSILTMVDTLSTSHDVIGWYIGDQLVAVVNKDTAFTVSGYPGFTTIGPGITFSTSFAATLTGGSGGGITVDNADTLDTLDSTQFMRTDTNTGSTGVVSLTNTTDSSVYTSGALVLSGGAGIAKGLSVNGTVRFTGNTASTSKTTGTLLLTGGIGISGNIYAGAIQNTPIGSVTRNTGAFTTLLASSQLSANAGTSSTSTTTGAAIITGGLGVSGNINGGGIATITGGIQNTPIGNVTANVGYFTNLTASGQLKANSGTSASNVSTGALVVSGGTGISGDLYVGGTVYATISGNVTTAAQITITDNPSTSGTYYLTFVDAAGASKSVQMDSSTLTYNPSTNTLTTGTFSGALSGQATSAANVVITDTPTTAGTYYITFTDGYTGTRGIRTDSSTLTYDPSTNTLTTGNVNAISSSAKYADLAEKYETHPGNIYDEGTVVIFGGSKEITLTNIFGDTRVAGAISSNPAYIMNSESDGAPVALRGKVLVKVHGEVQKGDLLVTSEVPGAAASIKNRKDYGPAVFAKALEDNFEIGIKKIYAVIL